MANPLEESPDAGGVNTSVQFIAAPNAAVNFGLHDPNDFVDSNPSLITPHYINGSTTSGGIEGGLQKWSYS